MAIFWSSIQPTSRSLWRKASIAFAYTAGLSHKKPTRRSLRASCARAASGQTAATLPSNLVNSRRFIATNPSATKQTHHDISSQRSPRGHCCVATRALRRGLIWGHLSPCPGRPRHDRSTLTCGHAGGQTIQGQRVPLPDASTCSNLHLKSRLRRASGYSPHLPDQRASAVGDHAGLRDAMLTDNESLAKFASAVRRCLGK